MDKKAGGEWNEGNEEWEVRRREWNNKKQYDEVTDVDEMLK